MVVKVLRYFWAATKLGPETLGLTSWYSFYVLAALMAVLLLGNLPDLKGAEVHFSRLHSAALKIAMQLAY